MADERMQGGEGGAGQPGPQCYLLVHNVSKKHNIGTLARSAVAFNVRQICLVGSKKYNMFGNHGSGDYMSLKHAEDLRSAREYLKGECGCQILGVEIVEGAKPIQDHPFVGNTAFILGNEGYGLTQKQMDICDGFVYIPQHGCGTASLNVTVAGSIVLHHFALWAKYAETEREGYKYVLGERPRRQGKRGVCEDPEEVRRRREEKRAAAKKAKGEDSDDGDQGALGVGGMFED